MDRIKLSKKMSKYLRHSPEKLGCVLDSEGYTPFGTFVSLLNSVDKCGVTKEEVLDVVTFSEKQRFGMAEVDGVVSIRANQGHTTRVQLTYTVATPAGDLYHGTCSAHYQKIMESGAIEKMARHHVHLSPDYETAAAVAARWGGSVVVLRIAAAAMAKDGHQFYLSDNGVWLVDSVPVRYLT